MIRSKSRLAIELSKLKTFETPSVKQEQYPVDSEIGAEVLWNAYYHGDIEGKVIADLGCGTGILGIGALMLKSNLIYFVDIDNNAITTAKENLEYAAEHEKESEQTQLAEFSEDDIKSKVNASNAVFLNMDVKEFKEKVDTVIQNPPFGTKEKHADKEFLLKAFEVADVIYSFHKATSKNFIEKVSEDNGFEVTHYFEFDFPLKMSHLFHKKAIHRIKVGCWRMEKKEKQKTL